MTDAKNYEIVPIKIEPDPILDDAIIKSESVENDFSFGSDGMFGAPIDFR